MVDEAMKKRLIEVLEGTVLAKVADEMGVSPQAVNGWKTKGFITAPNGFKLARLRGFNPEWLLTGIGPKKLPTKKAGALDVKRLSEILDAISREEKKVRIELSNLQRASYLNEMYCDQRLNSQPDFIRRTAEIIQLTQRR
jgi:phage repressor protein C with HTH and peptisase S24 domain